VGQSSDVFCSFRCSKNVVCAVNGHGTRRAVVARTRVRKRDGVAIRLRCKTDCPVKRLSTIYLNDPPFGSTRLYQYVHMVDPRSRRIRRPLVKVYRAVLQLASVIRPVPANRKHVFLGRLRQLLVRLKFCFCSLLNN